jgi:hypothetical protein
MKVKITKCSNDNWWYNDRIGEIFTPINDGDPHSSKYEVNLPGDHIGFIDFDDCEIFECS